METCNDVQKHRKKRAIRLFRKEEMGNKVAKLAFRGVKKVVNPGNSLGVTEHKNGGVTLGWISQRHFRSDKYLNLTFLKWG